MSIPLPVIPREHGAWAVLFVPMAVGASVTGEFSIRVLLFACSALGMFLSYVPAQVLLRHWMNAAQAEEKLDAARLWGPAYLGFGVLFILPLLLNGFWFLLPIGFLSAGLFFLNVFLTRRSGKTILSDLSAVFGLTLSSPGAYYVTTGIVDQTAVLLWAMNFLFFGCSVFYVHMKIKATGMKRDGFSLTEKVSLGTMNAVYHMIAIGIVVFLSWWHYTTGFAVIAFIPMSIHALYGTVTLSSRIRFKNLGFLLLAQSAVFGLILIHAMGGS